MAIETSAEQAPHLGAAMEAVGLTADTTTDDDLGGVVVAGRAP